MAYTGFSIVDYLKSVGQDSSFDNRKKLAGASGISGYSGTAQQNTQLLNLLRSKVQNTAPTPQVENKVIKPPVTQTSTVTGSSTPDPDRELARKIRDGVLSGSAATEAVNALGGIKNNTDPSNGQLPLSSYGQLPPAYTSKYSDDTEALIDKILNYKPFSYDYATDPSYQSYEKQYTKAGENAYQNTIGDLTAMTGGRLNSWATSAASQAKNGYMEDLSNIIPTLEQNAYSRYQNDFNSLRNNLGMLQDVDNTDYSRYRDLVGDYTANRNYDRGVLESDRNYDRGVLESDRNYDRGVLESDRNYDYQVSRDKVLDDQWLKQYNADEQQRIVQNAIDRRQISVSEGNAALNRAEFAYKKEQDAKEKSNSTDPTAGQLNSYNQIVSGLSKNPSGALSYIDRLGKDFYVNLIGENLYNNLLSEAQSGFKSTIPTSAKPKSMTISELDNSLLDMKDPNEIGDLIVTEMKNAGYSDTAILAKLKENKIQYNQQNQTFSTIK